MLFDRLGDAEALDFEGERFRGFDLEADLFALGEVELLGAGAGRRRAADHLHHGDRLRLPFCRPIPRPCLPPASPSAGSSGDPGCAGRSDSAPLRRSSSGLAFVHLRRVDRPFRVDEDEVDEHPEAEDDADEDADDPVGPAAAGRAVARAPCEERCHAPSLGTRPVRAVAAGRSGALHRRRQAEVGDDLVAARVGLDRHALPVVRQPDVARGVDDDAGVADQAVEAVAGFGRDRGADLALAGRAVAGSPSRRARSAAGRRSWRPRRCRRHRP